MDLLSRFWRICRAQLSSWLDGVDDPSKKLDLALHELEAQYRDAREKVVLAMASKKRLERSVQSASETAVRRRQEAAAAVRAGDAAGARRALNQCRRLVSTADSDALTLTKVATEVKSLQLALSRLEGRIAEAQQRRGELGGSLQVGEARVALAGGFETAGALESRRIGTAEAELSDLASRLDAEGAARMELAEGSSDLDGLAQELALVDGRLGRLATGTEGGR